MKGKMNFCYLIAVHMEIIEPEGGSRRPESRPEKAGAVG